MILPVKYPMVTAYTHHATLLSILGGNEAHLPWIYSNYMQLMCFPDPEKKCIAVDYYTSTYTLQNCPWLQLRNSPRDQLLTEAPDITQVWIRLLDSGHYLYFGIDGSYVQAYSAYKQSSYPHPVFVYGYDSDLQIFHIADFFSQGKFSFGQASFSELSQAYMKLDAAHPYRQWNFQIRYNGEAAYPLDLELVREQLLDYSQSTRNARYPILPQGDVSRHWIGKLPKGASQVGLQVYRTILSELFMHMIEDAPYDPRTVPIMAEHKQLVMSFIQYMGRKGHLRRAGDIADMYAEVLKIAQVAKLNVLKYVVSGADKRRYIPHVMHSLTEMAFREQECVNLMLEQLEVPI